MSAPGAQSLLAELRHAIGDERVLAAIAAVPRERFVPDDLRDHAYDNVALPIGHGQTISQPLVVARMLTLLAVAPGERVLDVGTGSGYHAALLAALGARVWSIERQPELAADARARLEELGFDTVTCVVGDGNAGLPDQAPFDAINVAASAPAPPAQLEHQLAQGGRLVVPIGVGEQFLTLVRSTPAGLVREQLEPVRFVPLLADD